MDLPIDVRRNFSLIALWHPAHTFEPVYLISGAVFRNPWSGSAAWIAQGIAAKNQSAGKYDRVIACPILSQARHDGVVIPDALKLSLTLDSRRAGEYTPIIS